MTILCETCTNNTICKYRDTYEKIVETMDIEIESPFYLTLNCPHFTAVVSTSVTAWSAQSSSNYRSLANAYQAQ